MRNRTIPEKKGIICEYIKKHPGCTCKQIKTDTKLKVERVYSNLKEAYEDAGVALSKNITKRNKEKQKSEVINYIKYHPGCYIPEIRKNTKVNVTRLFKSILNAYKLAGIKYPERGFISGVVNPIVVRRSLDFEKEIISQLRNFGEVYPKVKTTSGIVDCILVCEDRKYVVEVKDFRSRNNITMSQIKQLIKYLKELEIKDGIIVCPKDSFPKRKNKRNLYIDDLKIRILSDEDLWGRSIKEI